MGKKESRVGIRELRQNLSVYLGRIAESGESYEVTDRGRAVAILAPVPGASSPTGRLVAAGRATAARGDLLDLGPPRGRRSLRLSKALEREREERL